MSSAPRSVTPDWQEDYVFVHWGEDFRAAHSQAYPEMMAPAISVGLGAIGLRHILDNGGSGYFLESTVRPLIEQGRLHRVRGAASFRRPAYLVYPASPVGPGLLQMAIEGLKLAATGSGG